VTRPTFTHFRGMSARCWRRAPRSTWQAGSSRCSRGLVWTGKVYLTAFTDARPDARPFETN